LNAFRNLFRIFSHHITSLPIKNTADMYQRKNLCASWSWIGTPGHDPTTVCRFTVALCFAGGDRRVAAHTALLRVNQK
jgi:hypothetical protein